MKQKLLIVDDEKDILDALTRVLSTLDGIEIFKAYDGVQALEVAKEHHPDVILSDLQMPGMNGLELLKRVKELNDNIQFVLITGHGSIDDAVNAMKMGAYDFLQKPFRKQDIMSVMNRVLDKAGLLAENRKLKEKLRSRSTRKYEFGKSDVFRILLQRSAQAAASEATILILGESGTGKEVLANYIFDHSSRASENFVKVNCAAIPENLLEAELFGYKKGAFTGAYSDRKGRFHEAHNGTIFLDEIGELPLAIQSKLLRVLQEGEINPVGGATEKVNVRIVAATNRSLKEQMEKGEFREDLYYRLNVIPLQIPPLRNHMEDLPALVNHFVSKHCAKGNREAPSLSKGAFRMLEDYNWPGNIREVENIIERAIIFCIGDKITEEDLPEEMGQTSTGSLELGLVKGWSMDRIEQEVVRLSMQRNHNDKRKVADELGISLRTIYRKLDTMKLSSI
ncbi:sigma-54 dependent transcriptional regulator [Fibrobacterales bacterium]|nr:sigma-54 dependent transcriptional regulator [Fibrobacterales bacterium]